MKNEIIFEGKIGNGGSGSLNIPFKEYELISFRISNANIVDENNKEYRNIKLVSTGEMNVDGYWYILEGNLHERKLSINFINEFDFRISGSDGYYILKIEGK